ncbi:MAG: hypothetical protein ACLR23_29680 [Clostridia bacterium]|uniref:Uncharacterized protein n=1 Tax=Bianquea renquensis TaxID=2763661 RepID=A0A926DT14_9FIRM|nr:hypothetical protein [Bianquea renquensis]MBC8543217.1 hypothetical protein [Bianquea renquensis]
MNVIIHYPKIKQGIEELERKVASVHVEAVRSYIKQLPCPKEQKLVLLKSVQDDLKNGK